MLTFGLNSQFAVLNSLGKCTEYIELWHTLGSGLTECDEVATLCWGSVKHYTACMLYTHPQALDIVIIYFSVVTFLTVRWHLMMMLWSTDLEDYSL